VDGKRGGINAVRKEVARLRGRRSCRDAVRHLTNFRQQCHTTTHVRDYYYFITNHQHDDEEEEPLRNVAAIVFSMLHRCAIGHFCQEVVLRF